MSSSTEGKSGRSPISNLRAAFLPTIAVLVLAAAVQWAAGQESSQGGGHSSDRNGCSSSNPEVAIVACTNIIEDLREDEDSRSVALLNRGSLFQKKGDLGRAISDYTAVLKLSVGRGLRAKIYLNRGLVHFQKGDDPEALADYNDALTLDPSLASAYINRATILMKRDDLVQALADLDKATLLNPKDAALYVSRGTIYAHRGELDRAIADYTKAIEQDPTNAMAWRDRGVAYRAKGDGARAAADAKEAIRLDPNAAGAGEDRRLSVQGKGGAKTKAELDNAIALNPRDAKAFEARGNTFLAEGHRDRAIADFTDAINLDATLYGALVNRGVAYLGRSS